MMPAPAPKRRMWAGTVDGNPQVARTRFRVYGDWMNQTLEKLKQDAGPQWAELCNSVREHVAVCLDRHENEDAMKALAREVLTLCDQVDRLHGDLNDLLVVLENSDPGTGKAEPSEREIELATIEEQRETHDTSSKPLDILKALLMWRDDPAERVSDKR